MEKKIMIRVDGLTKAYRLYDQNIDRLKEMVSPTKKCYHRLHYALRDVSFDVYKGETIGVIGTNGSGKSTLLKILTGVVMPTEGTTFVDGKISALLELGAGFNPEYTGLENIYLNGTMLGYTREEMEKRIPAITEFADIGEFINQPVKNYSSGMFARLAFAVSINVEPDVLIVDEALSVGDVFFQNKCFKKFDEFREEGRTILLVTHDLSSVVKYCSRVVLLNNGVKVAEGTPKDMVDLYKKILVKQMDPDKPLEEAKQTGRKEQKKGRQMPTTGDWSSQMEKNDKADSYGTMDAEIIDFAMTDETGHVTNVLLKDNAFSVKMKVRFNKDIEDPIFAFTILNTQGVEITGTNTLLEHVDIAPCKAGDIREITFTQIMRQQGGNYLLSLGCTSLATGELVVYHRIYDACAFTCISSKNTVGYFDMGSDVSVREG